MLLWPVRPHWQRTSTVISKPVSHFVCPVAVEEGLPLGRCCSSLSHSYLWLRPLLCLPHFWPPQSGSGACLPHLCHCLPFRLHCSLEPEVTLQLGAPTVATFPYCSPLCSCADLLTCTHCTWVHNKALVAWIQAAYVPWHFSFLTSRGPVFFPL